MQCFPGERCDAASGQSATASWSLEREREREREGGGVGPHRLTACFDVVCVCVLQYSWSAASQGSTLVSSYELSAENGTIHHVADLPQPLSVDILVPSYVSVGDCAPSHRVSKIVRIAVEHRAHCRG